MARHADDLVKVTAGAWVEIQGWCEVLQVAGIKYQTVPADPTAEPGAVRPDVVELWVHRADTEAAETEMAARFHNSLDDRGS